MNIHPIEIELTKATGMKSPDKRDRKTLAFFRAKLVQEVDKLPDEDFDMLTSDSQNWINSAIDAIRGGGIPPNFDGSADDPSEAEEAASEPAEAARDSEGKGQAEKAPVAPQRAKKEPKSNVPKTSRTRGITAGRRVKELILEHGIHTDPMLLVQMLHQEHLRLSPSTLQTIVYEFKQSLTLLTELGLLTTDQEVIRKAIEKYRRV